MKGKIPMKISGIDEDFVDIINYLDKVGYKPFASCDGVLAHHDNPQEMVDDDDEAYIAFLESPKIFELMASFLKDGRFTITFDNSSYQKPYELYGNEIAGNHYAVYFSNLDGELTSYFKDIIMQTTKENIDKDAVAKLSRLSSVLEDNENSELTYSVSLNSLLAPNKLSIKNKEDCEHKKDMYALIDLLYSQISQFPEDEITIDDVTRKRSEFDILFSNEQFEQILGLISYCKDIEHTLPILENKEILFGFMKKQGLECIMELEEKSPLQQREAELSSLEAEEKTISEAEALINKQNQKEGYDIGE